MNTQLRCTDLHRRDATKASAMNGIDYLEITSADQTRLAVYFLKPLPATPALRATNVVIDGGERITGVRVIKVHTAGSVLHVQVDVAGDFSTYTLRLITNELNAEPPSGFDSQLSSIPFSFKVNCPSDIDCKTLNDCPPEVFTSPDIDYLAKDYASFRRLMLDRMSVIMPAWNERNAADEMVSLVEMFAYVGDQLSYYQDAVATEAYLGTARKRISVRRHARLLDYHMHEGCSARTWLHLAVSNDLERASAGDLYPVPRGAQFTLAGPPPANGALPLTFEPLYHVDGLYRAHNAISLYTWSDRACCLPKGATRATLCDANPDRLLLAPGDVVLFEEILGPNTGLAADADWSHRQFVRLTAVTPACIVKNNAGVVTRTAATAVLDPVTGNAVVEIEWSDDDALTFPCCLSANTPDAGGTSSMKEISIVRGNNVLADHGYTIAGESIGSANLLHRFAPVLKRPGVTHRGFARTVFGDVIPDGDRQPMPFDPAGSAASAMRWALRDTLPAITVLDAEHQTWHVQQDLLSSGEFSKEFVDEVDEFGNSHLRFGDDVMGERPVGALTSTYRVGNGRAGNVGAETITQIAAALPGVTSVRNPLAASGGIDPESMEEVRQYAPVAFRVQERAVTESDWEAIAQRFPDVQKAVAHFRWTGSWTTVYIAIDRNGGRAVDAMFIAEMRAFLERYRLAGYDLEVVAPVFVPLDISLHVCVKPGYFTSDVKLALIRTFNAFFSPDNFTFGQPVFLSRVYRAAMDLAGVASCVVTRFQRFGKHPNGEIDAGFLKPALSEIIRLDNDPSAPERGIIEFIVEGGL